MLAIRQLDQIMQAISKTYKLKKDKNTGLQYGPPYVYLGSQIWRYRYPEDHGDSFFYAVYGDHYMKLFVANVQKNLMYHDIELNDRQQYPFLSEYHLELYISP